MRINFMTTLLLVGVALAGCARPVTRSTDGPQRPALVNHVVFFDLVDPDESEALIDACETMADEIPGIVSVYAGPPLDIGRESVDGDYDVGFYVGFDSIDAYRAYIDHPAHTSLVATWGPKLEALRVHDVIDETR